MIEPLLFISIILNICLLLLLWIRGAMLKVKDDMVKLHQDDANFWRKQHEQALAVCNDILAKQITLNEVRVAQLRASLAHDPANN